MNHRDLAKQCHEEGESSNAYRLGCGGLPTGGDFLLAHPGTLSRDFFSFAGLRTFLSRCPVSFSLLKFYAFLFREIKFGLGSEMAREVFLFPRKLGR